VAAALHPTGGNAEVIWTSPDAITWTERSSLGFDVYQLVASAGKVFAIGWYGGVQFSTDPLDVVLTHKLGAPDNAELAIGAVAEDGTLILDVDPLTRGWLTSRYLDDEVARQKTELARRAALYRGGRERVPLIDRVVVVIDDGVATGYTLIAALRSIRAAHAARIIAAVPVGPAQAMARLRREADRVVCLAAPEIFCAVSPYYESFPQVSDDQVIAALAAGWSPQT